MPPIINYLHLVQPDGKVPYEVIISDSINSYHWFDGLSSENVDDAYVVGVNAVTNELRVWIRLQDGAFKVCQVPPFAVMPA